MNLIYLTLLLFINLVFSSPVDKEDYDELLTASTETGPTGTVALLSDLQPLFDTTTQIKVETQTSQVIITDSSITTIAASAQTVDLSAYVPNQSVANVTVSLSSTSASNNTFTTTSPTNGSARTTTSLLMLGLAAMVSIVML